MGVASSVPRPKRLAILVGVLFAVALFTRAVCFTGLVASDDLGYADYAQRIARGTYTLAIASLRDTTRRPGASRDAISTRRCERVDDGRNAADIFINRCCYYRTAWSTSRRTIGEVDPPVGSWPRFR
jgi:hypothetical protein